MLFSFLTVISVLAFAPSRALASGLAPHAQFSTQMYESGAVMDRIMATKMVNIYFRHLHFLAEYLLTASDV
jgi:hypothetical protein